MSKIVIALIVVALLVTAVLSYTAGIQKGKLAQMAVFKTLSRNFLTVSTKGADDYKEYKGIKFEILRVVFSDGVWFQLTSFAPVKIETNAFDLMSLVQVVFKRDIGDVVRIVHNHFLKSELPHSFTDVSGMTYEIIGADPYVFSQADIDVYTELKADGFKGEFAIWVNGDIIVYPKKETK